MRRKAVAAPGSTQKASPRHGLARVLAKLGHCSRTQADAMVRAGRVSLNGHVIHDPEYPTLMATDVVAVDGDAVVASERIYMMLNKPRGLVTTAVDERGRETVYRCFDGAALPWFAPVGRLDKASEGLLLFTNDTSWAAALTAPESHVDKTYHVQVDRVPDRSVLDALETGVPDAGESLIAKRVCVLRSGEKNAWLEIVLDEGRNRHIRRLLAALDLRVLRLVRVAIGSLALGDLAKSAWRHLVPEEVAMLKRAG